MQYAELGPHQLNVPGRHEADALTDNCERCHTPTQPAVVVDEVKRGKITGRYGIYRCLECQLAWLCWWAAPGGLSYLGLHDRAQDQ